MEWSAKVEMDKVMNEASGDISKEIGDINLAYMLLAQKLVKHDRAAAMLKLGVSRELADMLAGMDRHLPAQLALARRIYARWQGFAGA